MGDCTQCGANRWVNSKGWCYVCVAQQGSSGIAEYLKNLNLTSTENDRCKHPRCLPPNGFDEEAAHKVDASEVRRLWPRFFGDCPDCGVGVIGYVSRMHYYMGDW
jgi:hypothetical protein